MSLKFLLLLFTLSLSAELISQIKLKRPTDAVGIKIVDSVVERSFNIYEQLFDYHLRINEGEILGAEDMSQVEYILKESDKIIKDAHAAKEILKKEKFFTRAKATIHLERAKRAVYYCRDTSEDLLLAHTTRRKN
ncbi:hypothetical protein C8P64_3229 [Christiangramia gaetbulicola]|uniref:Uncharacterized protein n=1 Tax=Christiangramia gaetbulicola TaxID=703340 RepID=A0A2T6AD35_9FLAO|nr:hypothetical protein [Christiangramia gaetbulicola]PTX41729.1 hypothetical protein C8P64_3229 [Christiangramia gaetbulicola]